MLKYIHQVLTDKLNPFGVVVHQLSKVEKADVSIPEPFNDSCRNLKQMQLVLWGEKKRRTAVCGLENTSRFVKGDHG